jgi:hypothetical protein
MMLTWSKATLQLRDKERYARLAEDIRRRAHLAKHLDDNLEDSPLRKIERQTVPPTIHYQGGPKDHDPRSERVQIHLNDTIETGSYHDIRTGRVIKPQSDIKTDESITIGWNAESTSANFNYLQRYSREDAIQTVWSTDPHQPGTLEEVSARHNIEHTLNIDFYEEKERFGVLVKETAVAKRPGILSWLPTWVPLLGGHSLCAQFAVFACDDEGGKVRVVEGKDASETAWANFLKNRSPDLRP